MLLVKHYFRVFFSEMIKILLQHIRRDINAKESVRKSRVKRNLRNMVKKKKVKIVGPTIRGEEVCLMHSSEPSESKETLRDAFLASVAQEEEKNIKDNKKRDENT